MSRQNKQIATTRFTSVPYTKQSLHASGVGGQEFECMAKHAWRIFLMLQVWGLQRYMRLFYPSVGLCLRQKRLSLDVAL